CMEGVEFPYTF
nr:immunoglobulin light chain junction region [Macaca mulatta]